MLDMPDGAQQPVVIDKVKRPGGVFSYTAQHLGEDQHGHWLFLGQGSEWRAPHAHGTVPVDAVVLMCPHQPWVGWWVDDPADPRVEFDVCLPPADSEHDSRWSFVDLELDPVLHILTNEVEVQDWDEFREAVAAGVITQESAELAIATAETLTQLLRGPSPPWLSLGWERLATATEYGGGRSSDTPS